MKSLEHIPASEDIRPILRLVLYFLIAGTVPRKHWKGTLQLFAKSWSKRKISALREQNEADVRRIKRVLGDNDDLSDAEFAENLLYYKQEDLLLILRDYWSGREDLRLKVSGIERVNEGLERGKGVLLWVAAQQHKLVWKKALAREGLNILHLSRPEHGLGKETPFSRRFLDPIVTRVESRYVTREVMSSGREKASLRRLHEALSGNRVVSIQDLGEGRTIEAPFLTGSREYFVGAPSLAQSTGAALFPVFPMGEIDGEFVVTIGQEIVVPWHLDKRERLNEMVREFSSQLSQYVTVNPERWFWERIVNPPNDKETVMWYESGGTALVDSCPAPATPN